MTAQSTPRYDDLLVRAREAYVQCGFINYIGRQARYDQRNNIGSRGRFDLQQVPEDRLLDVIKTMENFNALIQKSGVEPVFHRELTTITLVQFLWNIEKIGVNAVFQSCCVVPKNISMEEHDAFRQSIREIYSLSQ